MIKIMNHKCTQKIHPVQRLIAGIVPGDYDTELFGIAETRKMFGICNGSTIPFNKVNPHLLSLLANALMADTRAMEHLGHMDPEEALEEYAFHLYGSADGTADFTADGKLGLVENTNCSHDCYCWTWNSKRILINDNVLTRREVQVSQLMATDLADKQIATLLGISQNTLVSHKRNMYGKAGVMSRAGYVAKSFIQNVLR